MINMAGEKTDVNLRERASSEDRLDSAGEAVHLAHEVEQTKYKPFTVSMMRLYGCLAIAYLCGCLNGYDGSLMGGINGMKSYQSFFGM